MEEKKEEQKQKEFEVVYDPMQAIEDAFKSAGSLHAFESEWEESDEEYEHTDTVKESKHVQIKIPEVVK